MTTAEEISESGDVSLCRLITDHYRQSTHETVVHMCNQNFWKKLGNWPQQLEGTGCAVHLGPPVHSENRGSSMTPRDNGLEQHHESKY